MNGRSLASHPGKAPRLICLLTLALIGQTMAGNWTTRDGAEIAGDPTRFDFEEKSLVFADADGRQNAVAARELSNDSRWRLLLSPTFSRSFPEDRWSPEQIRYVQLAVAGPVLLLLVSFWICAIVLFKNANPLRAFAGWIGSALLGGFLMGFYLMLSGRSPGSTTGILLFGIVLSAGLLSVYVSAIYKTSTLEGLKLLVLHVFAAFFFLAIGLVTLRQVTEAFHLEKLVEEKILVPVGMLGEE